MDITCLPILSKRGSLALNLRDISAHFPEVIYDEDWLFLYDATVQGRVSMTQETFVQNVYNPFASEKRAAREEFGNVISGRLYDHLKQPSVVPLTDKRYWKEKIAARKQRLDGLYELSQTQPDPHQFFGENETLAQQMEKIKEALAAAIEVNLTINAEQCVAYYTTWHEIDTPHWNAQFDSLPTDVSVEYILQMLDLLPYAISSESYVRKGSLARF